MEILLSNIFDCCIVSLCMHKPNHKISETLVRQTTARKIFPVNFEVWCRVLGWKFGQKNFSGAGVVGVRCCLAKQAVFTEKFFHPALGQTPKNQYLKWKNVILNRKGTCNYCDSACRDVLKLCSGCKTPYCSKKCQKKDWNLRNHKHICKRDSLVQ